eukprot:s4605_g4.t1
MAESSDAYSFGQAAAPAAGSQSNTSQSIDTGGSDAPELRRPSIPVRAFVEPRGRSAAMAAIEDKDNPSEPRSGSRRPPVATVSPPSTPRKKSKRSDPPSPIPVVTPSGPGSFQKVSMPSTGSDNYSLYRDEVNEYRTMMEKVEEENNDLRLRIGEIYSFANQQFVQLESATQSEMQSMAQQLQLLNAELTAAKQEDEGATYRIEELERYKLMSDERSSYLQHQYAALRTQFAEQMDHATTIVAQTGHGLRDQVDRLRCALENAEITARQESMAVSMANEQACTLRVEMLEAVKQGQVMKNTMAVSIRKMETELDAADLKREEIMLEFRSNLRQEQERLADCEHRLALEESQCHLDRARNERRAHQERREADQLRFKSEYKALRDELVMERMKAESSVALNTQHDAIEAAKKSFQDELNEAKVKMENDTKKLREDLKYAEERKNHYKNNYAQVEDRYLDEEKAYQAEADAFERLRNEYNKNVQDLKDMEKENEKSRSKISRREAEKITVQDWPRVDGVESWKSEVIHEVCIASGDDDHDEWKTWLAPCFADTPDLVLLGRQSEKKFQSIDAKLAHGLRKMIDRAGNESRWIESRTPFEADRIWQEWGLHQRT